MQTSLQFLRNNDILNEYNFVIKDENIFIDDKKILLNSCVQTVFFDHEHLFQFLINYKQHTNICKITLSSNELVLKFDIFGKTIKYKLNSLCV